MLLLETDLARFSEADILALLAVLPPTWAARITRKKTPKARLQSAVGYSLLRAILQSEYGVYDLPAIVTDEHGKPFLENCGLFFSISHCNTAIACVVEDQPVAVDVQDILTNKSDRFKARLGAPADLDDRALTALWTQKEASAKLDGRGLSIPLSDLPLSHHTLDTSDYGDFIITIAHNK